jgi:hypothetical protein
MRLCKDCGEPTGCISNMRQRCVECTIKQRRVVAKNCKNKYQYHKQPKNRYATYKRGAERRGYTFSLTIEEFTNLWNKPCSYCNTPILGIGIDRQDNTIGYTVNNTIACCTTCNFMKGTLSHKEFIDKCVQIAKCFTTVAL